QIVCPLLRPAVATMVILNTFSVWNDFVNPQIILGPGSGLYTVTTGVYAAVSQYATDYTVVFPTLLLAIAPLLVFFVFMQRHIISGLTAGSTKG
ncbi:MAG TPA: carbohydrate ABC transporter permease, partial [Nonomuraea sp.]|nr:carbohydrate ABC transporter permease [Nonomuraea sp.]